MFDKNKMIIRQLELQEWGNSFIFVIPKEYLRNRNLESNKKYDVDVNNGK